MSSFKRKTVPFDFGTLDECWTIEQGSESTAQQFARFGKQIEKSPNDTRDYSLIKLVNGVQVMCISDPTTDKAAVSLSVGIGHLNDPDDLPGLAHFCEHMLFLGTEKYPSEAAYKVYLSENSGSSNAFTSMDETNYYLDCHPSGLPGALSRHSQFFTAPLFLPSCTERELKAVDSEFKRNLMLDSRRAFQLGKETSSREAGSRYWKFGTGNMETLRGGKEGETREKLIKWYDENYSGNLMNLVIFSSHSLDDLERMAIDEYSNIPNSNQAAPHFDIHPLGPDQLQTQISYRTIKDTPQLKLAFPFPDQRELWSSKPAQYVSHFVGHEGKGSILEELKSRNWASSLSAGAGGVAGWENFSISVSLTADGLVNYKEVVRIIFAYLDLLRSTRPQESAFLEMRKLGEIGWKFKESGQPGPMVKNLASALHSLYPREKLLSGPWFATKFDEGLIVKCLEGMIWDKCKIMVGSQEGLEGKSDWELREQYYGTEYDLESFSESQWPAAAISIAPNLSLPGINPFVPDRLELVPGIPGHEIAKRPSLIRQTTTSRLFFKKDDQWKIPRATAFFLLKSPLADQSAKAAIKSQIFTSLVEESLSQYSYEATLAGLDFSVGNETDGIQLVVSGYSDKLSVLLEVVVERIKGLKVDPSQFALIHERLSRAYANARLNNPSTIADSHLRHATRQTHWTYEERILALEGLTPDDIQRHGEALVSSLEIDALIHGNLSKEEALNIVKTVEAKLKPAKISDPDANDYHRALVLPAGTNSVYRPLVTSPENVNSAASIYYQVCPTTDYRTMALLELFSQIAKTPIFSTLRTTEQLGYIVSSGAWSTNGVAGFRVMVQSEKVAGYLEERVEALWSGFGKHLEGLGEVEFSKQKESVMARKRETIKNLGQETSRYWYEIENGRLDFFSREREALEISSITSSELATFFQTYILLSPTRTTLSILMRSQRFQAEDLAPLTTELEATLSAELRAEANSLLANKPTMGQIQTFVNKIEATKRVKEVVSRLGEMPVLPEGVQEILDLDVFRIGLKRADKVEPVGDFRSDLVAHL